MVRNVIFVRIISTHHVAFCQLDRLGKDARDHPVDVNEIGETVDLSGNDALPCGAIHTVGVKSDHCSPLGWWVGFVVQLCGTAKIIYRG